jgi:hypothetical protein
MADTTSDQRNVIVLREMVLVMRLAAGVIDASVLETVVARRAARPNGVHSSREIESREIFEIFAIARDFTR